MDDSFNVKYYRDPSESSLREAPDMLADLKAAQDELAGSDRELGTSKSDDSAEARGTFSGRTGEGLEAQIGDWVRKIQSEQLKLEQAKTCLEESLGKVNGRIEKIKQLKDAIEKTRKNLETIHTELSSAESMNSEILGQIEHQISQLQKDNEQRNHYFESAV